MAINKKNFRKITVDEIQYFWKVTPDQWMLRLFITRGDNAYCNLISYFNQEGDVTDISAMKITPTHVSAVIKQAFKEGWHPDLKGENISIKIPKS